MGKWACEEMSQVFGMVWHCRDGWKIKWAGFAKAELPWPPSSSLRGWRAGIVSLCCAEPLRVTLNPQSPSKSGSSHCPGCLPTTHPILGSVRRKAGCAPCPAPAFPPRSGPSVRLGLLSVRLSFILFEVLLGSLPQRQPAHTLLPCR